MGQNRIVYQEWIVKLGCDPARPWHETVDSGQEYNNEIMMAVTGALETLPEDEATMIRHFYFQGLSYREISRITGREIYRLDALHRRALRKLTALLRPLVEKTYGRNDCPGTDCALCNHPARQEIDRLIHSKRREETWKRTIKTLQQDYALPIRSPQQIISHLKFHHPAEKEAGNGSVPPGENIA